MTAATDHQAQFLADPRAGESSLAAAPHNPVHLARLQQQCPSNPPPPLGPAPSPSLSVPLIPADIPRPNHFEGRTTGPSMVSLPNALIPIPTAPPHITPVSMLWHPQKHQQASSPSFPIIQPNSTVVPLRPPSSLLTSPQPMQALETPSSSTNSTISPPSSSNHVKGPPTLPLSTFLEGAWAEHTKYLESTVEGLQLQLAQTQEAEARAIEELQAELNRRRSLYAKWVSWATNAFKTFKESTSKEAQTLKDECDALKANNDALVAENTMLKSQSEDMKQQHHALCQRTQDVERQNALFRNQLAQADRDRASAAEANQILTANNGSYVALTQTLQRQYDTLKGRYIAETTQLRGERDIARAGSSKAQDDLETGHAGNENVCVKAESPVPKSETELWDALELQYPQTPASDEDSAPVAVTSKIELDDAETQTFSWDVKPAINPRKRSRREFECDSSSGTMGPPPDPELSMGDPFPVPRQVDVKSLNSPIRWFMQIRRKNAG